MSLRAAPVLLIVASSALGAGCGPRTAQLGARDGLLRGRDIALSVRPVRGGFVVTGRMRVAVPPGPILALFTSPRALVRLFPGQVAGSGRWPRPATRDSRFFLAVRLFGRIFATWGVLTPARRKGWTRLRWRTDRDGWGYLLARRLGAGSDLRLAAYVPARTELAGFLPRLGGELLLRLALYSFRSRLERLWRRRLLPSEPLSPRASWAGVSPHRPRASPGRRGRAPPRRGR